MFDTLIDAKEALNVLEVLLEWLKEAQIAIEYMWIKLRKYYDKSDKPFEYVNVTLLYPYLKKKFMQKARYNTDIVHNYIKQAELCYQNEYDPAQHVSCGYSLI